MKLSAQLACLALAPLVAAHFKLQYPPSLGFDEDIEPDAPCGGFPIAFSDSDTSVPVGGFPISLFAGHPAAQILYRGTLNQSSPFTWVDFKPVVSEVGLNQFCIPDFVAPSSWAGKSGLVQVEYVGPDGPLFQCAAVKWVSGTNSSVGSGCTNSSGVSASVLSSSTTLTAAVATTATAADAAAAGTTAAGSSSSSGLAAQITGAAGLVIGAVVGAAALL